MNVLIIGKNGQLAWELQRTVPDGVIATAVGSDELDVTDSGKVFEQFRVLRPDVVINCAAYTAVDKAELEIEKAFRVNDLGVKNVAGAAKEIGARVLHISTDFVFDGTKATPYGTTDLPNPVSVYGDSKLAGERMLFEILPQSLVVRTAWVYSIHGNNFVKTMLRLMAERSHLGVVYDQVGTPTWARGLALWLWSIVNNVEATGIYHWTDAGVASWYDFAVAIQELALAKGLLAREIPIAAIPSTQYPTPARRPSYSVLDKHSAENAAGLAAINWRKQLSAMLDELAAAG